jgi:hypothetical protein
MTGLERDTLSSPANRWVARNGLLVASFLAMTLAGLLGGALFANFVETVRPGGGLLLLKLTSVLGGRYVVAALTLILLISSQWMRGKVIHLRQEEYDRTGERVLRDLRADPQAKVPDFYLYLRAFETTGKLRVPLYLRVRRKCFWVYQRLVTDDLESYTSLSVRSVAPLVALGRPGENIGAGRILTGDDCWQADIVTLMKRAKGILLIPSDREGTVWEMDALKREELFSKVVFVMPPHTTGGYDTTARWEAARAAMAVHGLEAPEHQDRGLLFRLGSDGKILTAEPLLLSSPRKIRKAFKRLFKDQRKKGLYKSIVKADKRASRAAFWGWLENARQLSVFPVALVAVLLPTANVGFNPAESWKTVFERFMTASDMAEFDENLGLSANYQAIFASVPAEQRPSLKSQLVGAGLSRIQPADQLAYYSGIGGMLMRVDDKHCAAMVSGQVQPDEMQILRTYIPPDRIDSFLKAETDAVVAAAQQQPAIPIETGVKQTVAQQFVNSLDQSDQQRYLQLGQNPESMTATDKCWLLRTQLGSLDKLPQPMAAAWVHALTAPENPDRSNDQDAQRTLPQTMPDTPPAEPKIEPQRAALVHREAKGQEAPASYVPRGTSMAAAPASAQPVAPPPDPTVAMLDSARADISTGHLTEPASDCALAWALRAKQAGNVQGAAMESQILDLVGKKIVSERLARNYESAIADVNGLMSFYPGQEQLVSLKGQIEAEQQRVVAEAQLKRFVLQHRHILFANNGAMMQAYCVGILIVAPDGTARFDCTNTVDPQGRCDHVIFPSGSIKQVKMQKNGSLHVATNRLGNFDFYGAPTDLQGAYDGLTVIAGH